MDFGFVQVKHDDNNNKLVRSRQGFGSYLLIIDEYTCYMWAFPTKSKSPPFEIIDQFLIQYKRSSGMRRIRTDLGKELAGSKLVRATIAKHGYTLEPTAPNSSFQNSKDERPHRTLGNMMKSMLKGANLDKRFWADALLHAVYLKNRLPHQTLGMTPYERMMRRKPDLSHLRVFGTKVIIKDKNIRNGKLTDNVIIGIFLRFTGIDRNILFFNTKTNQTHSARHVEYDETHYHDKNPPRYAQCLQNLVQTEIMNKEIDDALPKKIPLIRPTDSKSVPMANEDIESPTVVSDDESSEHKCLSSSNTQHVSFTALMDDTKLPIQATKDAAGYDLFSAENTIIPAGGRKTTGTGVSFECSEGYFDHILSRSGLSVKHGIEVGAGVIDQDYEGELKVVLCNHGDEDFHINKGDRIAQIVI